VSVVSCFCGILDVGNVDGDTSVPLLGCIINHAVILEFGKFAIPGGEDLGDGSGEGGLPVIHVPNGSDVAVRFVTLEDLLLHKACCCGDISATCKS